MMKNDRFVYLDYAATTPPDPRVIDVMVKTLHSKWGNFTSHHRAGFEAKEALDQALDSIAAFLQVKRNELIITSGATESINQAIKGVCHSQTKKHIITSTVEHKATLQTVQALMKEGYKSTFISPNRQGLITPEMVEAVITDDTAIISLIWVNNETGDVMPVESIAKIARARKIPFHVDGTQTAPHQRIDASQFDLLSMSGHKCYGPKGVGILYRRYFPRLPLTPLIDGSGGQLGIRSGTMPNEQITGLAEALELCAHSYEEEQARHTVLADKILTELAPFGVERNCGRIDVASENQAHRIIPSILNLWIPDVHADALIHYLPELGFAKGSACNSDDTLPSYVLTEMGYSTERSLQSIRLSLGRFTNLDEIEFALLRFKAVIGLLQSLATGRDADLSIEQSEEGEDELQEMASIFINLNLIRAMSEKPEDPPLIREVHLNEEHLKVTFKIIEMDGKLRVLALVSGVPYMIDAVLTVREALERLLAELVELNGGFTQGDFSDFSIEAQFDEGVPSRYLRDFLKVEGIIRTL